MATWPMTANILRTPRRHFSSCEAAPEGPPQWWAHWPDSPDGDPGVWGAAPGRRTRPRRRAEGARRVPVETHQRDAVETPRRRRRAARRVIRSMPSIAKDNGAPTPRRLARGWRPAPGTVPYTGGDGRVSTVFPVLSPNGCVGLEREARASSPDQAAEESSRTSWGVPPAASRRPEVTPPMRAYLGRHGRGLSRLTRVSEPPIITGAYAD